MRQYVYFLSSSSTLAVYNRPMSEKKWCYLKVHPRTKVKVDEEDLERLSAHSWRITRGTTGRPRVVTSVRKKDKVRTLTLGQFLMRPPKGKQVYPRRFNDGLDYRKQNLILCSLKERQRLLPKNRRNRSSVYRGVSFLKRDGKWRAAIEVNGRAKNLGNYATEIQAAAAYNTAARKAFGDIAYQNPIGRKFVKRS